MTRLQIPARIVVVLFLAAAAATASDFMLGVGQSRIVKIPDLNDKSVLEMLGPVQVTELGSGWVKLTGTGSGNGRLRVQSGDRTQDYTLTVVTSDPADAVVQLAELLKGLSSPLSLKTTGGRVIVEGTIKTQADRLLYDEVMEYFPDAIKLVRIEAPAVLVDVSALLVEVERSSGHDVSVLDIDLSGSIETGAQGDQHEGFPVNWDRFLNWRVDASAQLLDALKLDLAKGRARIVARPEVVTTNGEKATLLSGGELPYSASGFWGSETRFKPYGVRLEVTPQVLPSGEVSMDLLVEASQPGDEHSSGIVGRRAELKVAVEKGKSLMVAGLSNSEEQRRRGCGLFVPLFRSSASVVRRELLVIVTPSAQPILGFDKFEMLKPEDLKK